MNDYERITRVIAYLDEHYREQPTLEELAELLGLSSYHFQRLFTRWAGISPDRFRQCLTLAHAKGLLRKGKAVLESSLDAGLSGPGRLHDLCLNLEGATPGDIKNQGKGWSIYFGTYLSPFGNCLIADGPKGVCHISFFDTDHNIAVHSIRDSWPLATLIKDPAHIARIGDQIFQGYRDHNLRMMVRGTHFQIRVWQALLALPAGHFASYGDIADYIGNKNASRAVGSAIGKNQLAYLIPCHRVIRETGVVGNYRWGNIRKKAILVKESNL